MAHVRRGARSDLWMLSGPVLLLAVLFLAGSGTLALKLAAVRRRVLPSRGVVS